MRVGMNPQKQDKKIKLNTSHCVISVVYIPEMTGYYAHVLEVFKLSLQSIIATKNNQCTITVVNNACCKEVVDYLEEMFATGKIDCVIHNKNNIGKMDALIGAARGAREPLITLTDVDILFKKGWQENVETIHQKIENVGSVSPLSVRKSMNYGTSTTLGKILMGKVGFSLQPIPENFDDHNRFMQSINWNNETDPKALWPVVEKNGIKAILGSAHQVMTIRREILFTTVPEAPSLTLVGNNSEFLYVDEPVNKAGGMRLATYHNFAYHMGNAVEDWMVAVQQENLKAKPDATAETLVLPESEFKKPNDTWFYLTQRLYIKLFNSRYKTKQL